MILTQAIASTILNIFTNKIMAKMDEIKPKDIQVVKIKTEPNYFSYTELMQIVTRNQKWTTKDNPQFEFLNPLKKESVINTITLTPDHDFGKSGKL